MPPPETLAQAEAVAKVGPPKFEQQLLIVKRQHPVLYARFQHETAAVEAAPDKDERLLARHILENPRQEILRYETPQEVAT
jgi:hypothetical protein